MKKKTDLNIRTVLSVLALIFSTITLNAGDSVSVSTADLQALMNRIERLEQQVDARSGATPIHRDSTTIGHKPKTEGKKGLTVGGYGEATYKRAFYSNNYMRYSTPENYSRDGFGEFDLPHVCIYLGYDFGHGWSLGSEIEFEHGGTESAVEIEEEEGGEYETEVERGGEVALEQLWVQKSFAPWACLRAGMLVVPIGGTNAHHEPNQFFGVYRPEGENTILPCTWHDLGIQFSGRWNWLGYTVQFLPGLESDRFSNKYWIHYGSASAYEFKLANTYAGAARLDFYPLSKSPIKNQKSKITDHQSKLRLSLSAYCGTSFKNYLKQDLSSVVENEKSTYYGVKGTVSIAALDWCYEGHNMIFRGSGVYGHLSDADKISRFNKAQSQSSVSKRQNVASDAYSVGVEYGYEFFHFNTKLQEKNQRFYLFARYDIYDSEARISQTRDYWCGRQKVTVGVNYFPIPEVALKAEYGHGFINQNPNTDSRYNDEPYLALGVTYCAMFTR